MVYQKSKRLSTSGHEVSSEKQSRGRSLLQDAEVGLCQKKLRAAAKIWPEESAGANQRVEILPLFIVVVVAAAIWP